MVESQKEATEAPAPQKLSTFDFPSASAFSFSAF
jgi:hypothetical protein